MLDEFNSICRSPSKARIECRFWADSGMLGGTPGDFRRAEQAFPYSPK